MHEENRKKALCCDEWVAFGGIYAKLAELAKSPEELHTINEAFGAGLAAMKAQLLPFIGVE